MSGFRASGTYCVIVITYVRPLDEVDGQMKAHIEWLEQGFRAGVFVVAGRQDPRTGGVILARGERDEIEQLAAADPFITSGVGKAEVIQFNASFALDGFTDLAP